jgi:hypothetical protein
MQPTPTGSIASEIERQKLDLAARTHAVHLAHRIATDKRFTGRDIEHPEALKELVATGLREQSGGGGETPAAKSLGCRILVWLVFQLADLGLWGACQAISAYAIEAGCWKGV